MKVTLNNAMLERKKRYWVVWINGQQFGRYETLREAKEDAARYGLRLIRSQEAKYAEK